MNNSNRVDLLTQNSNQVMDAHPDLFATIISKSGLSKEQVLKGFITYNTQVMELDNDIYASLDTRVAMFIEYLMPGSWHEERQGLLLNALKKTKPKSIIDIGFGAPSRYMKEYVLPNETISLTLTDKYRSAIDFAQIVLPEWDSTYASRINMIEFDMDMEDIPGQYQGYIFQDSIEHTQRPKALLSDTVARASADSYFYLSIPIAPLIPCHHIYWEKEIDATDWLSDCGLELIDTQKTFVQSEKDLFAEELGEICDLFVVARPK